MRNNNCSPANVPVVGNAGWPVVPAGVCQPAFKLVDESCPSDGDSCKLVLAVSGIARQPDGRWEISLSATGARGAVEVSTNRRQYDPGLIVRGVVGSPGKQIIVYAREVSYKNCERAIQVTLNLICEPPAAPALQITQTTCSVPIGTIALLAQPAGLLAYWYTGRDGTGVRSLTPPAYSSLNPVTGSVLYARVGNEGCRSEATNFTTAPQPCLCTAVSIDTPTLPTPRKGVAYSQTIPLKGTAPFSIADPSLPGWLRAQIVDTTLILSGTPTAISSGDPVGLTVKNCDGTKSTPLQLTLRVLDACVGVVADWVVVDVRCQAKTTTNCTGVVSKLDIAEVRCDTAPETTPVDTCAGVKSNLVVAEIRCSPDDLIA